MKDPRSVVRRALITEKGTALRELRNQYHFEVDRGANKIEIKRAIEEIYNAGRKDADKIVVADVHTVKVLGKLKRVRTKSNAYPRAGHQPDRKKAIITLAKGQALEDYGV